MSPTAKSGRTGEPENYDGCFWIIVMGFILFILLAWNCIFIN